MPETAERVSVIVTVTLSPGKKADEGKKVTVDVPPPPNVPGMVPDREPCTLKLSGVRDWEATGSENDACIAESAGAENAPGTGETDIIYNPVTGPA